MVKAISKMQRIVEALSDGGPMGVSELADRLELPKSTLHRYLMTMADEGLLVNEGGQYRVALRFLDIGERARRRNTLLPIAKTELDEVTEETGYPAHLVVAENDHAVFLYESRYTSSFRTAIAVGKHVPLSATAGGHVLLAEREEAGAATAQLSDSAKAIRSRGYATLETENERSEIAAPIQNEAGNAQAAVGVTLDIPPSDVPEAISDRIRQTAKIIEIKSDYSE